MCDKTSNNKYPDCPPRMNDGRHFTDYRSQTDACFDMSRLNAKLNSYEFRQFMIENGSRIIAINNNESSLLNSCAPCGQKDTMFNSHDNCVNHTPFNNKNISQNNNCVPKSIYPVNFQNKNINNLQRYTNPSGGIPKL